MMGVYDNVKMSELLSVEEADCELILLFQGGKRVTIKVVGDNLVSEVSD